MKVEEDENKQQKNRERNLPYQCSRVVLVDQSNCFFPVNEEKEEEGGEE